MEILEATSDNDDSGQDNAQVEIVLDGVLVGDGLDRVGDKAQDCANPQECRETAEKIATELDPFGRCLRKGKITKKSRE